MIEQAADVPYGFESDDLYLPDVWVSEPMRGGDACGAGERWDCWNLKIMSESGCDPFALLTIVERDKSGAELERYQRAVGAGTPGQVNDFSWSSQHWIERIIHTIEVERAGCTDAM